MEFILRGQSDSVARMDEWKRKPTPLPSVTGDLVDLSRNLLTTQSGFREASRVMTTGVDRLEHSIHLLTQIASSSPSASTSWGIKPVDLLRLKPTVRYWLSAVVDHRTAFVAGRRMYLDDNEWACSGRVVDLFRFVEDEQT